MIDKPAGVTSHDVVRQVRRALGTRAVGHTGTLDPFATGLLVVLVGRGTRLARFIEQQAKTYRATMRLGIETDTDDATGTVLQESTDAPPEADAIERAVVSFIGRQLQQPPVYSAKRVAGERSYRMARRGQKVELTPVEISVRTIDVLTIDGRDVSFRVTASAGTYIRALARDIGKQLGIGGHLTALRREAIGELSVDGALPLGAVGEGIELVPLVEVMGHLPTADIDERQVADIAHGRPIANAAGLSGLTVLRQGTELVAVAQAESEWFRPKVVLVAR